MTITGFTSENLLRSSLPIKSDYIYNPDSYLSTLHFGILILNCIIPISEPLMKICNESKFQDFSNIMTDLNCRNDALVGWFVWLF